MSYDMVVGKGARRAPATPLAGHPNTWLQSEAHEYDPSYYQAFYKRVGAGFVNARVFAPLGASQFTVQLHDDQGWRAWQLGAESCSCGLPTCEHRQLLAQAQLDGLALHRAVDRTALEIVRSPDHIELRATRRWPEEVGPRVAYVYPGRARSVVRLHETGEHPLFVLEGNDCTCAQSQPCMHRQLLEFARTTSD